MDEAVEPIILSMKNLMSMMAAQPDAQCFLGADVELSSIEAACGRPSRTAAAVDGASLHQAESDMFPCLVVICGSAFALLKVSTSVICF